VIFKSLSCETTHKIKIISVTLIEINLFLRQSGNYFSVKDSSTKMTFIQFLMKFFIGNFQN